MMMTTKIKDPLFSNTKSAFDIFYSDEVVIEHTSKTNEKMTYYTRAYAVEDGIELSEEEVKKDVELYVLSISLADWSYKQIP